MAIRLPSLADGRVPLLVAGVLTVLLGLITAGSGLVGPEPLPEEAAAGSSPPIGTVLLGPAAPPPSGGGHCRGTPACHPGDPRPAWPATRDLASADDDPGQYLSKMAALRRLRRAATVPTLDPYQASLNPAVYLASDATPIAEDRRDARQRLAPLPSWWQSPRAQPR